LNLSGALDFQGDEFNKKEDLQALSYAGLLTYFLGN